MGRFKRWLGIEVTHPTLGDYVWDIYRRTGDIGIIKADVQNTLRILKEKEDIRVRGNKRSGLKKKEDTMMDSDGNVVMNPPKKKFNSLLFDQTVAAFEFHLWGQGGGGSTMRTIAKDGREIKIFIPKDVKGNYMEDMVYVRHMNVIPKLKSDGWNSSDEPPTGHRSQRSVQLKCHTNNRGWVCYVVGWYSEFNKGWNQWPNTTESIPPNIKILGWRELEKCDE